MVLCEISQTRKDEPHVRPCLGGAEGRRAHRGRKRAGGQAPGAADMGLLLGGDRVSASRGQDAPQTACVTAWTYLAPADERPDQAVPGQGLSRGVQWGLAAGTRPQCLATTASPAGCLGVLTTWRPPPLSEWLKKTEQKPHALWDTALGVPSHRLHGVLLVKGSPVRGGRG